MTTREPYDIPSDEGTERPHAEFTDWQARPSAGAWLNGGVVLSVLVIAVVFWTAVTIGWR